MQVLDSHRQEAIWQSLLISKDCLPTLYPKGSLIFIEGSPVLGIYYINSGKVKIVRRENEVKSVIIKLAKEGELIGHSCFFNKTTYGNSAIALEDTYVTLLEKTYVFEKLIQYPNIFQFLAKTLSEELDEANKRTSSLITKSAGERIANFLIHMLNSFGRKENGVYFIDLHLSREEVASCVGTTPETVIRYFSIFKEKGFFKEVNRKMYIIEPVKLQSFATTF